MRFPKQVRVELIAGESDVIFSLDGTMTDSKNRLYLWKVTKVPNRPNVIEDAFNDAKGRLSYVQESLIHQLKLPGLEKDRDYYLVTRAKVSGGNN